MNITSSFRWKRHRLPLICIILLAIVKFFLISEREIVAGEADPKTYVESADVYYWNTPYTAQSFIRLPGYPLFLAVASKTGIPLRLLVEVIFLLGSTYLALGLAQAVRQPWAGPVAFFFAAYQPFAFIIFDHVLTDTVVVLSMLLVGGSVARLLNGHSLREKILAAAILSTGFAIWTICRPESPLNYLAILIIGVILTLSAHLSQGIQNWRLSLFSAWPAGMALASVFLFNFLVKTANYHWAGFYAPSEMEQPGYAAAQRALLSIQQEKPKKYVPIPEASRLAAYKVSPEFERLHQLLESPNAAGRDFSTKAGITNDIGGGWLYWTLRWAVFTCYNPKSPAELDGHFQVIADQINIALATGKLPRRKSWSSFINANYQEWVPHFPQAMEAMLRCTFSNTVAVGDFEADSISVTSLFDRIANRRIALVRRAGHQVFLSGWAAPTKGDLNAAFIESKDGRVLAVGTFHSRPDVQRYFLQKKRDVGERLGFSFEIHSLNPPVPGEWQLSFWTDDGNLKAALPASQTPGGLRWLNVDQDHAIGTIDVWKTIPSKSLYLPNWMNNLNVGLLYAGAVAFVIACWRVWKRDPSAVTILLLIFFALTGTLLRCSLYAVIHAAMWDATQSRYLFPTTPVLYASIAALVTWSVLKIFSTQKIPYGKE